MLGKDAVTNGYYGQEINITTYNLCRINMFLHDVGADKFNIRCEDTLRNPQHWDDEPFELIVSNPPLSLIYWRAEEGLTPTRSDLAISDVPTVITLVERGMGWSILPAICLDGFGGIVTPLCQNQKPITRKTHFLYREGHLSLPQLSAFLEIAKKHEKT